MAEGILVGSARISITPDMSGFLAATQTKLKGSLAGLDTRVPLHFDIDKASVAKAQAALGPLAAGKSVPLRFNVDAASAARARAALGPLAGDTVPVKFAVDQASLARADAQVKLLTADTGKTALAARDVAAGFGGWVGALSALRNIHVPLFGGGLAKMGLPSFIAGASGLHLLTEAIIETTAVVVPASVALGAFGLGAAPTVQAIAQQMKNLYTVSQALNVRMPGMTGGFSKMVAAVQPQVYSIFGDALDIINHKGTGLETMATGVGASLDQLAARFTLAVTGGNAMNTFAEGAVNDFSKLGDIVGNLGGAFGNVLHVMPGYAKDLLGVADAGSRVLETFTRIAEPVIGFGLSAHGAIFYTGLLATGLLKLGTTVVPKVGLAAVNLGTKFGIMGDGAIGAAKKFGASGTQLAKVADNLGGVIGPQGFARAGSEAETAASKTGILSTALGVLEKVPVWGWVALGTAALGGLTYWMLSTKSATVQWIDTLQSGIDSQNTFTGVISATALAQQKLSTQLAQTTHALAPALAMQHTLANLSGKSSERQALANEALLAKMPALSAGTTKFTGELALEHSRMGDLTKVFGSTGQALGVFTALHIKANAIEKDSVAQWKNDIQQAKAYVSALTEMAGYTGGRALAAQQAFTLSQSSQAKAVAQVTQAEDAYITTLTGGEQAFITWTQDLRQADGDASKYHATLGGLNKNSLTLANDFWSTLIPAGQKQIDSLNAQFIGTKKLTTATATIAKGMLPLAKGNDAARVAIMDLVNNALGPGTVTLKNMNGWIGQNSTSLHGFKAIVDQSTIAASQLAKGLQTDLNVQFRQDLLSTSNADSALKTYTADLDHNRADTAKGHADRATLIKDLEAAGLSAKQASTYVDRLTRSIADMHSKKLDISLTGEGKWSVMTAAGRSAATKSLIHSAAGGRIPGYGGGDIVPALLEPGETVVPKHLTPQFARAFKIAGIPGFAAGGVVPSYVGNVGGMAPWATNNYNATINAFAGALAKNFASSVSSFGIPGAAAAGTGAAQQIAKNLLGVMGWSGQWPALDYLWTRESGWRWNATNPTSGAYGIPQSLPASKMAAAGADWRTDPATQIRWGLGYIKATYGDPDNAAAHEMSRGWYDAGGILPPGLTLASNLTGRDEFVLRQDQIAALSHAGGERVVNYNISAPGASISDVRAAIAAVEMRAATRERIGRQQ